MSKSLEIEVEACGRLIHVSAEGGPNMWIPVEHLQGWGILGGAYVLVLAGEAQMLTLRSVDVERLNEQFARAWNKASGAYDRTEAV